MRPRWTPQALRDVTDVSEYIRADNPPAAEKLINYILKCVNETLLAQPLIGKSGRVAHTREFVVHPSYILVYRTRGNLLEIIALRHSAQKWPKGF